MSFKYAMKRPSKVIQVKNCSAGTGWRWSEQNRKMRIDSTTRDGLRLCRATRNVGDDAGDENAGKVMLSKG